MLSTSLSFEHWPLISHQPSISALGIWLINCLMARFLDPLTSPTSCVTSASRAWPTPRMCHCFSLSLGLSRAPADGLGHDRSLLGGFSSGMPLGAWEGWFLWLLEESSGPAFFPYSEARHALSSPTAISLVTAPAIPLIPFRNAPNPASWKIPALPGTSCSCPVLALTLPQGN